MLGCLVRSLVEYLIVELELLETRGTCRCCCCCCMTVASVDLRLLGTIQGAVTLRQSVVGFEKQWLSPPRSFKSSCPQELSSVSTDMFDLTVFLLSLGASLLISSLLTLSCSSQSSPSRLWEDLDDTAVRLE